MTMDKDFKKAAFGHGILGILLLVFFGVGFYHTQNTDWDGSAPYWVFGAVGGFVQFLCVCCAVNVYGKRNSATEMNKALGLYRFLIFLLILWSFAGTVASGVTGVCANLEECAYQENQGVNKGMGISIMVMHIISFIYACVINGDLDTFKKDGSVITPAPKPGPTIQIPYDPGTTISRNAELSSYNTPLPTTYNILPPPSGTLPPPPSYESIVYGVNPAGGLETLAPPVAEPRPNRLAPLKLQRKVSL